MNYVLSQVDSIPAFLEDDGRFNFKFEKTTKQQTTDLKHEETTERTTMTIDLPESTKYLSVEVAGSKNTRYSLFEAMFQGLATSEGTAAGWDRVPNTVQHLELIILAYLVTLSESKNREDEKKDLIDTINQSDDFLRNGGKTVQSIEEFVKNLSVKKLCASLVSTRIVAFIFRRTFLILDEKNGAMLVRQWNLMPWDKKSISIDVCLIHEMKIEGGRKNHYYRVVKKTLTKP